MASSPSDLEAAASNSVSDPGRAADDKAVRPAGLWRLPAGKVRLPGPDDEVPDNAAAVVPDVGGGATAEPKKRRWTRGKLKAGDVRKQPAGAKGKRKQPAGAKATPRRPAEGRGRGRKLTLEERELVVQRLKAGVSQATVAKEFGVTQQAIAHLNREKTLARMSRDRELRKNIKTMLQAGHATYEAIARKLSISISTIPKLCPEACSTRREEAAHRRRQAQEAKFAERECPSASANDADRRPRELEHVLKFKKPFAELVLNGRKTLDIRHVRIDSKEYWISTDGVILGRALLTWRERIDTADRWIELIPEHHWDCPELPYRVLNCAFSITNVTRLSQPVPHRPIPGFSGKFYPVDRVSTEY